jgi:hypothetical protein
LRRLNLQGYHSVGRRRDPQLRCSDASALRTPAASSRRKTVARERRALRSPNIINRGLIGKPIARPDGFLSSDGQRIARFANSLPAPMYFAFSGE